MIIVTGGAGFIGSNLIKELNKKGNTNIIVVDDLTNGYKFKNLAECDIEDYFDYTELFDDSIRRVVWEQVSQIYHEGAISSTTEWDGKLIMKNNYTFSTNLLNHAIHYNIPFSYASSASVYGKGVEPNTPFKETDKLNPLNVYAYSKLLFDKRVESVLTSNNYKTTIIGNRYFNVYGTGEEHKGDQASPIHKFYKQATEKGYIEIFKGSENFVRDFICVDDVVKLKVKMLTENISGIFNLGTGETTSFKKVADIVSEKTGCDIEEIPFPNNLREHYQDYTCADLTKLKEKLPHSVPKHFKTVFKYFNPYPVE
jgi:ADP-L-glycero-D-manno-heptose 6-epimerase